MGNPELIKVCLVNRGEDAETPWAEDLGPSSGPRGSRKVRLVNVPFLHAKPTYGDIVVVSPVEDGLLTWDRDGVAWTKVRTRIAEDGGRWAMIVDYAPHDHVTADAAFQALAKVCDQHDLICEGAWGPEADQPGRAYLAVDNAVAATAVMATLADAALPVALIQVHPAPGAAKVGAKPKAKAKTAAKAKPKAKPRAKAKAAAKSKPKSKPKAKPKANAKTNAKTKAKARRK